MRIGIFFDYVFYRIAKAYHRFDGNSAATAVVVVGWLPALWVVWIMLFIDKYIFVNYLPEKGFGQTAASLCLIGIVISGFRYRGKFAELKERWINESSRLKTIKGILIVGMIAFTFLSFFLL